jgi:hypothetical protein
LIARMRHCRAQSYPLKLAARKTPV